MACMDDDVSSAKTDKDQSSQKEWPPTPEKGQEKNESISFSLFYNVLSASCCKEDGFFNPLKKLSFQVPLLPPRVAGMTHRVDSR